MDDPITVQVVGLSDPPPATVSGVARAKELGLKLSKAHPSRWVDAKRPNGEIVHAIAPVAFSGGELLPEESDTALLPGQEAIF